MKLPRFAAAAALALSVAGCTQEQADQVFTRENIGTVLGGVGGAVIGAQFGKGTGQVMAAAAGTLVGAFVGREIGRSLDRQDVARANQAQQRANTAPIGQQISWSNPESGNSGSVTPVREGRDTGNNLCREYRTTVKVGGREEEAWGTACRQADGSWKIVS
jgi:surface antigen